jgi:hypothetical protein
MTKFTQAAPAQKPDVGNQQQQLAAFKSYHSHWKQQQQQQWHHLTHCIILSV